MKKTAPRHIVIHTAQPNYKEKILKYSEKHRKGQVPCEENLELTQ